MRILYWLGALPMMRLRRLSLLSTLIVLLVIMASEDLSSMVVGSDVIFLSELDPPRDEC